MPVPLRVVVVDDSTTYRKVVRDALAQLKDVEVVGHARDGEDALRVIEQAKPDLITLDLEMPVMDGMAVLESIRREQYDTKAIMLCGVDHAARHTQSALCRGAMEFIVKPNLGSYGENIRALRDQFRQCIAQLTKPKTTEPRRVTMGPSVTEADFSPEIILLGISTGGPEALRQVVGQLPAELPIPLVIVQHMPAHFTRTLATSLDRVSSLRIREAVGGELAAAGHVYLAPGGKQLGLLRKDNNLQLEIVDALVDQRYAPSLDHTLHSAAQTCGGNCIVVVMTGMGDDGRRGCAQLKQLGATVLAQDEASCTVYGMPKQIIEDGNATEVNSLNEMAAAISRHAEEGTATCI